MESARTFEEMLKEGVLAGRDALVAGGVMLIVLGCLAILR